MNCKLKKNILFIPLLSCILFIITYSPYSSYGIVDDLKKNAEDKGIFTSKKKSKDKLKNEDIEEKEKKKDPLIEGEYEPVLIGLLLEKPVDYIDKKIKFRGRFSSFTTLALDYKPALRKSKDYISLCIFRADSKIPLSELKLSYSVIDAKEDPVIRELEEGDLLEIYGKVFSASLDEPWVDIIALKKLEGSKMAEETAKKTEGKEDKIKQKGKDSKGKKE